MTNEQLKQTLRKVCEIAHDLQTAEIAQHQATYANYADVEGSRWNAELECMTEDLLTIKDAMKLAGDQKSRLPSDEDCMAAMDDLRRRDGWTESDDCDHLAY